MSGSTALVPLPAGLHPETAALVEAFAAALAEKLRAAELKHGWSDDWKRDDWARELRRQIRIHVEKGDPLDVAAYAAFAWSRRWSLSSPFEIGAG